MQSVECIETVVVCQRGYIVAPNISIRRVVLDTLLWKIKRSKLKLVVLPIRIRTRRKTVNEVGILSLIHISEPTRRLRGSRMPSSA